MPTRRAVWAASALVIFGALLFWLLARPAYRHYRASRAVTQARGFLARGDARNASLSARRALAADPRNVEACRVMAELAEAAGTPQALEWRRRIAELSPTTENKLLLAASALRTQKPPFPLTTQILTELAGSCEGQGAYHVLAAERALKLGRFTEAETHFEQAARLEPAHHLHQLNLAALRLRSTNALAAASARATLERLATETNLALLALRWLADDSLARKQWPEAGRFSDRLLALPESDWNDRLKHLRILQQSASPAFENQLGLTQSLAATNPAAIYAVCAWLNGNGLAGRSRDWITGISADLRSQSPVRLALAETCISLEDWQALDQAVQGQEWGDFEFLRLAYSARAAAEQQQDSMAEVRWRQAVRQVGADLAPLRTLLAMADSWDPRLPARAGAAEAVLWQIIQRFPDAGWAIGDLTGRYARDGNTRGLHKLFAATAARNAADLTAKNNYATTSMLLGLNLPQAHAAARDIYLRHPEDPVFASTYAYSLHLQGRTKEALSVLEKMPAKTLERPALALYYGVLLSADGQRSRAATYLGLASQATLLPEEKTLVSQAQKRDAIQE